MQKLKKDFDIEAKGYLDLSDVANKKFKCNEKWSLNGLTMHLVSMKYMRMMNFVFDIVVFHKNSVL